VHLPAIALLVHQYLCTIAPAINARLCSIRPEHRFRAAIRVGKKKVTATLTPADHKRLRRLALERDATTEALLVGDLFAKYGIAQTG
jgi:hypothetical protein